MLIKFVYIFVSTLIKISNMMYTLYKQTIKFHTINDEFGSLYLRIRVHCLRWYCLEFSRKFPEFSHDDNTAVNTCTKWKLRMWRWKSFANKLIRASNCLQKKLTAFAKIAPSGWIYRIAIRETVKGKLVLIFSKRIGERWNKIAPI